MSTNIAKKHNTITNLVTIILLLASAAFNLASLVNTTTDTVAAAKITTKKTHKTSCKRRRTKKGTKQNTRKSVTNKITSSNDVTNQNTIVLPSGYTWKTVDQANNTNPNLLNAQASAGMQLNHFHPESPEDDQDRINAYDVLQLTAAQYNKINAYTLNLLNSVRSQAGVATLVSDNKTQKLAQDIAREYQINGHSILDQAHYIPGIVKAAKENGLRIDQNYIEDLAGDNRYPITSMTDLKKIIYWNLCQMLFGGSTGEDGSLAPGVEYEHAASLLDPSNKTFGIATGYTPDGYYSTHFIVISSNTIAFSKHNGGSWR